MSENRSELMRLGWPFNTQLGLPQSPYSEMKSSALAQGIELATDEQHPLLADYYSRMNSAAQAAMIERMPNPKNLMVNDRYVEADMSPLHTLGIGPSEEWKARDDARMERLGQLPSRDEQRYMQKQEIKEKRQAYSEQWGSEESRNARAAKWRAWHAERAAAKEAVSKDP